MNESDRQMIDPEKCGKVWGGRDGKEHQCFLLPGHGLTCECDCGERKWMGRKLLLGNKGKPAKA